MGQEKRNDDVSVWNNVHFISDILLEKCNLENEHETLFSTTPTFRRVKILLTVVIKTTVYAYK